MAPPSDSLDSYWRLNDYRKNTINDLRKRAKDAGYRVTGSMQKPELVALAHRMDRNMLCYDACTAAELDEFNRNRRTSRQCFIKAAGVPSTALIMADEWRVFRRFTKLPPELRCRIYAFYVAAFPETLTTPSQPPLARTCKLVRKEVLPIFYSQCAFGLNFVRVEPSASSRSARTSRVIRPTQDTTCFLETLTKENAEDIRNLHVRAYREPGKNGRVMETPNGTCVISVNGSRTGYSTQVHGNLGIVATNDYWQGLQNRRRNAVQYELEEVLNAVAVRDGKLMLTVKDIFAFRRALDAVFHCSIEGGISGSAEELSLITAQGTRLGPGTT
ncbi:hypothetical protein LTR36_005069 [Oleoguttula mirabilis]|uniref:Rho termination factor N-terminal domain-containing protein n=1 Tax=Oleoguttula mirabilis TaxID=1507867 RepID=A0AAV9JXH6_9PEZI|nr:hypothetical protein LTR36_005069 [Oleoguttula mirabilis]